MPHHYPTHPDFARVPVINFRFNGPLVSAVNLLSGLARRPALKAARKSLRVERLRIPAPAGHTIEALCLRPHGLVEPAPLLLYLHGGAFAMTYGFHHVDMCHRYAAELPCVVLLVDYRLIPANPWPAGFDDCYHCLQWARAEAGRLGIDAQRIVVGGDSAGGALSAGVVQKALDEGAPPAGQLLIYPVTDSRCSSASLARFGDTPLWNGVSTVRMWRCYLAGRDPQQPPAYAAPAHRADLSGLPPAYVETAEFDPLTDEGRDYAAAMRAAGVAVRFHQVEGAIHGFEFVRGNALVADAMARRIDWLRQILLA
jgi:acetyl esterase/lipase